MAKNIIRLTESQLKDIIHEAIAKVIEESELNEISYQTVKNAYDKMRQRGQEDRANNLNKTHQEVYNDNDVYYDLEHDFITLRGDRNQAGVRPFAQFRYGDKEPYISRTGTVGAHERGTPNLTTDPRMARKLSRHANRFTGGNKFTPGDFRK